MTPCPACNKNLSSRYQYCPYCGEQVNRHKFTFKHIVTEFIEGFLHLDHKIFTYTKLVLTKPWFIAYEYLHGRRKKYFNPFVAFVLSAGILVLFLHYYNDYTNPRILEEIKSYQQKLSPEEYQEKLKMYEKSVMINQAALSINKYFHVLNLFIYALPYWLFVFFFFKKSYNYLEMVFLMMVLWTGAMIYYIVPGVVSMVLPFSLQREALIQQIFSLLLSIFIGYNVYKFLFLTKKQWYWWLIFSMTFYIMDHYVLTVIFDIAFNAIYKYQSSH